MTTSWDETSGFEYTVIGLVPDKLLVEERLELLVVGDKLEGINEGEKREGGGEGWQESSATVVTGEDSWSIWGGLSGNEESVIELDVSTCSGMLS